MFLLIQLSEIISWIQKLMLKCWIIAFVLIIGYSTVDHNNGLSSSQSASASVSSSQQPSQSQQTQLSSISSFSPSLSLQSSQSSSAQNDKDKILLNTNINHMITSQQAMNLLSKIDNVNKKNVDDELSNNGLVNKHIVQHTDEELLLEYFKEPMVFGTENSTVVTTQIGATAHLPCTIHHKRSEGVVSWIRKKDHHLLTVGLTTYSSDERFSATHLKHSEDWTLQIKYVQLKDIGQYECQVSTHPPTSIFIELNVVEARAEIIGQPVKYLTPGSVLKLNCRVIQSTEMAAYIFWYHNNRMINYDVDRGINVSIEANFHNSELTILNTQEKHSGNYTCVPSNSQPASVLVHIFKGDHQAAYHEHRSLGTQPYRDKFQMIIIGNILLILYFIKTLQFYDFCS